MRALVLVDEASATDVILIERGTGLFLQALGLLDQIGPRRHAATRSVDFCHRACGTRALAGVRVAPARPSTAGTRTDACCTRSARGMCLPPPPPQNP